MRLKSPLEACKENIEARQLKKIEKELIKKDEEERIRKEEEERKRREEEQKLREERRRRLEEAQRRQREKVKKIKLAVLGIAAFAIGFSAVGISSWLEDDSTKDIGLSDTAVQEQAADMEADAKNTDDSDDTDNQDGAATVKLASVGYTGDSVQGNAYAAADLSAVPQYSGSAYTVINGNVPYFSEADLTTASFETYSALDSLGRCGAAYASIGQDLMPTEKRGSIGQVKPSGWHTVKYDNVDGKYLYNRCHLIGYQLTAENANERNLITGTRYLNIEGMLPFENMTADYIKETGNHVLYRVTPVFDGNNLVASGVLMEAESVEDKGEGILFCVYCYNVQPGITIDYATGDSSLGGSVGSGSGKAAASTGGSSSGGTNSSGSGKAAASTGGSSSGSSNSSSSSNSGKSNSSGSGSAAATAAAAPASAPASSASSAPAAASSQTKAASGTQTAVNASYILNTNSKKFHYPTCSSVNRMSDANKKEFSGSRDEVIGQGYDPCRNCNP